VDIDRPDHAGSFRPEILNMTATTNENIGTQEFDVVVVGCGIAGLSAAVSALEMGARVAILERSGPEDRGGQTRWTEAAMRMKSEHEVADDFESHFAENSGHYLDPELISEAAGDYENWSAIVKVLNFTDPELISTIADRAGPTLQWLKTFGVRFDFQPSYFITTCTTRISPVGGGLALIEALAAAAEKKNASFFYRTTARDLLIDASGRVCGIEAVDENRRTIQFKAKSVVLGSGGFQGNPEMLTRYLGPKARYLRPVARGGYYNKGEGIGMAMAAGAAPSGDYGQVHAEPLDPRSGAPEPIVLVFNYGILVNKRGERFIDEAPSTVDASYEAITRRILDEPEGIAWAVLDSGIGDVPNWKRSVRSDQPPVSADTLDELAAKIGVPADVFGRTVASFNAACAEAEGRFNPLAVDGLKTAAGYAPPKSNWARPIEKGPFLAYPLICGNCFTFGGIKVNTRSEVVDADAKPIPGLYAAGEMTGLYYGTYTGATSVLRGAVFGRIAGQQAAG
jgi:tricarballylate dehydrogenase